jgi:AcrR family transcriptional regulator
VGAEPGAGRRSPGRPRAGDGTGVDSATILDAALRAFATQGYDGVSLRTLNRDLGVSHSLISQRFGTKHDLWLAAVEHGFGRMSRLMADVFDPTIADPLEQLRLWIRRFLSVSADHPELLGIVNIEGRRSSERLTYLYDHYTGPSMARVDALLKHLAASGRIRAIPLRTFYFLVVHGGAAAYTLMGLAEQFDPASPLDPGQIELSAELTTSLVIDGLRVDQPG